MEQQPIEVHPIAELIAANLEEGGEGQPAIVLRAEGRAAIEKVIDELAKVGSRELMFAAQTMFSFADQLEARNAQAAAAVLVAILDRPNVVSAMTMINEGLKNEVGTVEQGTPGDEFATFASKDTARRAPAVGEEAPDDAVKLDKFDFPKRL
jgi:hypothetical protein